MTELTTADIRKRSPLYDDLDDQCATLLYLMLKMAAGNLPLPMSDDEKIASAERLMLNKLAVIKMDEDQTKFWLDLTDEGRSMCRELAA